MARSTFRSKVDAMRFSFRDDLRRGLESGCAKTAGTCRKLLAGETHLWTFVRAEAVERMLSVAAACRQQNVDVLDYLTRCYQADLDGHPITPSDAQAACPLKSGRERLPQTFHDVPAGGVIEITEFADQYPTIGAASARSNSKTP